MTKWEVGMVHLAGVLPGFQNQIEGVVIERLDGGNGVYIVTSVVPSIGPSSCF